MNTIIRLSAADAQALLARWKMDAPEADYPMQDGCSSVVFTFDYVPMSNPFMIWRTAIALGDVTPHNDLLLLYMDWTHLNPLERRSIASTLDGFSGSWCAESVALEQANGIFFPGNMSRSALANLFYLALSLNIRTRVFCEGDAWRLEIGNRSAAVHFAAFELAQEFRRSSENRGLEFPIEA